MIRTTFFTLIAWVVLASAASVANATTHLSMRLLGVDYLGDLPTLVAIEQGLFRHHGLDVAVELRASGKQNLQALRDGEADIALMATTPLVLDLVEHPPAGEASDPLILASLVHSSRLNHVVSLTSSEIRDPSDLAGRRVGLMAGTNAEYHWWLFTVLHRIDPDTVSVIDLPVEALPEALATGDIDAAVLWEPWTSRLEVRLGGDLMRLPGSDIYTEHWVLVATRGLIRQDPQAIRDLLAAYRDAIAFIERSPDQALDLYIDNAGLEANGILRNQDLPLFGLSLNWSLLTALMETAQWARDTAEAPVDEAPPPLAWIASDPLRDVMPLTVGIPAHLPNDRIARP